MKMILPVVLFLLGSGCTMNHPLGSQKNPIKLYFTPSIDAEAIATGSHEFIRYLEKETGFFFKTGIPANYIAVVEAFGSGRADIGVMNSFGYLLAHDRYGAEAKLKIVRYGLPHYFGQIIAHADSGIKSIKDLDGKRFAFTDPSSTSGHIFALKAMKDQGVKPSHSVFASRHDNVVTMIYQKQVDAGAAYYSPPGEDGKIKDARARVKTQFPDIEEKVKIIHVTDPIPNDPFVFRKGVPEEVSRRVVDAVKKFAATTEGQKVIKSIYDFDGIVDASDDDYNDLRAAIKAVDIDAEKLL